MACAGKEDGTVRLAVQWCSPCLLCQQGEAFSWSRHLRGEQRAGWFCTSSHTTVPTLSPSPSPVGLVRLVRLLSPSLSPTLSSWTIQAVLRARTRTS
eukprot:356232-Chlamydomonas_euryale.AAC.34